MKPITRIKRIFQAGTFALLCTFTMGAQVGINTTSPSSASALEIRSTDKGFLMTKVALTGTDDLTTITPSVTTGLLVYNTATAGSAGNEVAPGFYYFDGTSWQRFFTQGYTLSYKQSAAVTASTSNTTYVTLPGLDTGDITVPFSGTYQIRVEGFYSAGDLINASGDGAAQGSISLALASAPAGGGGSGGCSGGISAFPYNESFEASLGGWTQDTGDDINWLRDSGGTPSSGTGPSTGSNGSWYMYIEASGGNNPGRRAILNSPCFDFSGETAASVNFDYHMNGTNMGTLDLEISDDNGASWSTLWSQSGSQGNSWNSVSLDLSAFAGGGIQLRFNGVTGNGWSSDIAVDNVSVTNTAGPPPTPSFSTLKETYITTSSKRIGGTMVNNLAQSATIIYNINLVAGTTYRFAVRGREWLANGVDTGSFGRDTSGYIGSGINDAQRGTMTISLIKQN